jgi:tetratricopeptide (TPR) repeat protein
MSIPFLTSFCRRPKQVGLGVVLLAVLGGAGWLVGREAWARYHWRAAETAADRRDFQAALAHLACCRSAWPDRAEVRLHEARNSRRAGSLDDADAHLHAYRDLQGISPEGTLERLLLTAQRGPFADVEEPLRARYRPDTTDGLLIAEVVSACLMRANRLQEARQYLDDWLRRRPDDTEALVRRGWVLEHLFDFPGACRDYQHLLDLDPGREPVRLRLAEDLMQSERAAEALPHLEELRRRLPDDSAVRLCWIRCQVQIGRLDEARAALDALLASGSPSAQVLGERGAVALAEGAVEQAEGWLRQARALAPHDRAINYQLLLCLERLGKSEQAAEVRREVQQIDADQKRLSQLTVEVMRRPHDAALRHEVAGIFLRNGLRAEYLRWLLTAVEADPRHRPSHEALVRYYEEEGQPGLAAPHRAALEQRAQSGAQRPQ